MHLKKCITEFRLYSAWRPFQPADIHRLYVVKEGCQQAEVLEDGGVIGY